VSETGASRKVGDVPGFCNAVAPLAPLAPLGFLAAVCTRQKGHRGKHRDMITRTSWPAGLPTAKADKPLTCFCGQPDDRERVHRAHACEPWLTTVKADER
jgi:hypothetical protein